MFQWLKSFNLDEKNLRNFLEKAKSVGDIASQITDVDAQIEALMKKKETLTAAKAEAEKEILSFDHAKLFAQAERAEAAPKASEEIREPAVAEAEPAAETSQEIREEPKPVTAISVPEFLTANQKRAQAEPTPTQTEAAPKASEEIREPATQAVPEKKAEHSFVTNPAAFLAARRALRTSAQSADEDPSRQSQAPASMSDFINS